MRRSSVDWVSIVRCSTLYKYEHLAVVVVVDNSEACWVLGTSFFYFVLNDIKSIASQY